MNRERLARIGYSDIYTFSEERSAYFFETGMMIDADGDYRTYHPEPSKELDYLANVGTPVNWWGLVTNNALFKTKMILLLAITFLQQAYKTKQKKLWLCSCS